jgi:hypothetical protein
MSIRNKFKAATIAATVLLGSSGNVLAEGKTQDTTEAQQNPSHELCQVVTDYSNGKVTKGQPVDSWIAATVVKESNRLSAKLGLGITSYLKCAPKELATHGPLSPTAKQAPISKREAYTP